MMSRWNTVRVFASTPVGLRHASLVITFMPTIAVIKYVEEDNVSGKCTSSQDVATHDNSVVSRS